MTQGHLNQEQLAERWGLHVGTLSNWRSKGIGPKFLKLNGKVLYRTNDVQDYEQNCLRSGTGEMAKESA